MDSKKHKKSKSKHKSSKHKSKKHDQEEEEVWTEIPSLIPDVKPTNETAAVREDWMTKPMVSTSVLAKKQEELDNQPKFQISIAQQRELNPFKKDGETAKEIDGSSIVSKPSKSGQSWRLMKLQKVFDIAESQHRSIEEVALERYGSIQEFHDAMEEHSRCKDDRINKEKARYKKQLNSSQFQNPLPSSTSNKSRAEDTQQSTKKPTIIPSFEAIGRQQHSIDILSKDELNKLQAQIIKAKIMNPADVEELEKKYEYELNRAQAHGNSQKDVVIPNFDAQGRLQDVGKLNKRSLPGNKKKREVTEEFDKFGKRLRYHKDDDKQTLDEMVLQEKMASHQSYDDVMANAITKDSRFQSDLDYLDDASQKMSGSKQNEEKKRNAAILNFKRSQGARDSCLYCVEDGKYSKLSVVASGTKAFLALPNTIDMVLGNCIIVPNQHVLCTLELEDDAYEEIRNFMKCLIRMFAQDNQGVVFMEQVVNFKWQKHTVIECIPVPAEIFEMAPQYFKEAILATDEEWSTHKKIIDTSQNGIRRSMVKNLPYFHVWFNLDKGYGHIIEDDQSWPSWFGKEVLAGVMDLPSHLWRKPKWIQQDDARVRLKNFSEKFKPFDWTAMLE